jgi:hypothetical protein
MALTEKLGNIADAIRGKTGSTAPLTLDGMAAAIAGIQTGGGSASGIYMAQVTPAEDSYRLTVAHNLGTTDILFAMAAAETLGDVTPTFNGALGKVWVKTNIPNNMNLNGFCWYAAYNTTNNYAKMNSPNSVAYWDSSEDENTFRFNAAGAAVAKYIAGVTYNVVIVAANAFSVAEV